MDTRVLHADAGSRGRRGRPLIVTSTLGLALVAVTLLGGLIRPDQPSRERHLAEASRQHLPAAPAPPSDEISTLGVGVPARDGDLKFVVTGVERPGRIVGSNEWWFDEAQGEFVVVRVDVTNISDAPAILDAGNQVLLDDRGRRFEVSDAIWVLPDSDEVIWETVNPGSTVRGAPLVFDVTPGLPIAGLEVHDSDFSEGVVIDLRGQ